MDFVIITALEEEFNAVAQLLPDCKKLPPTHDDTRVYFTSELPIEFSDGSKAIYRIALLCLHAMGRVEAANATNDAIRRFSPTYVLLIGIAGGFSKNEVSIGDILISDQVVDYELQKVYAKGPQYRFTSHKADPRLLNAANHHRVADCLNLLSASRPDEGLPNKHKGAIATGDKVVANKDFLTEFLGSYPKSIGVEMESGGVASAAFNLPSQPGFFMIRAVSDWSDENKDSTDTKAWRKYACELAAAYAISLLKTGPVPISKHRGNATSTAAPYSGSPQIEAAKKEILLQALKVHNIVQTVLQIGSQISFAVANQAYNGEDEALVFIEALKQLISEGLLEGYFERATKNYPLSYEGLKVAKALLAAQESKEAKPLKRSQPELVPLDQPQVIELRGGESELCNQMVRVHVVLPKLISFPVDREQWSNYIRVDHLSNDGKTIYSHTGTGSTGGKPLDHAVPVIATREGRKLTAIKIDPDSIRDKVVGLAITQEGRFVIERWGRENKDLVELDRVIQRYDLSEQDIEPAVDQLALLDTLIDGIVFDKLRDGAIAQSLERKLRNQGVKIFFTN